MCSVVRGVWLLRVFSVVATAVTVVLPQEVFPLEPPDMSGRVMQSRVLCPADPECGDMFENGNYRRRRRMKRQYHSTAPYPKALYGDAAGFRSPAHHHHHHHHQLPLGTRNLFGAPTGYPPAYTRYDPR
jgi:hypothetical protein